MFLNGRKRQGKWRMAAAAAAAAAAVGSDANVHFVVAEA
jgi:hypothetical protein